MTGSLTSKNGKYYVIVRIPDEQGKLKQKWINTGISTDGNNKRKAQQRRIEILTELERKVEQGLLSDDILFSVWIEKWMETKKATVRQNTLESYRYYIDKHIKPYFDGRKMTLKKITVQDIEDYYSQKLEEGQSPNSIKKHNVVIFGALREAVKKKIIPSNPAEYATLPKVERFIGKAYTAEQANQLLNVLEDEEIKPAVILGLCYGLRRSEVCGLRWRDIHFADDTSGTMEICNTVVKAKTTIEHENTKSKASRRTMELVPDTVPYFRQLQAQQERQRKRLGKKYPDQQGHVCVHKDGRQFAPDYVTHEFAKLLERHGMPHIRFHELRHTAGSLLLEQGISAKQIQAYLGHENISVTLDTYTHLSVEGKKEAANVMGSVLKIV